jgi:hypothetical protein
MGLQAIRRRGESIGRCGRSQRRVHTASIRRADAVNRRACCSRSDDARGGSATTAGGFQFNFWFGDSAGYRGAYGQTGRSPERGL